MFKIIAHDIVNDITLIKTSFDYSVRYGLQVTKFPIDARGIDSALEEFANCQQHALGAAGEYD